MTFHIQQAAVVLGHMVVGPKSTNLPTEHFTPKPIIQETNGCLLSYNERALHFDQGELSGTKMTLWVW
jgi:hypothetical protein